jgi:hypothetical protein
MSDGLLCGGDGGGGGVFTELHARRFVWHAT